MQTARPKRTGATSLVTDVLLSKTVRLALLFAGFGFVLILGDAAYFQATSNHLSYVPEFYGLLGAMFTGVSAKNFGDNYLSYKQTTSVSAGTLPIAPVKQ